jgi:hypothetical protein
MQVLVVCSKCRQATKGTSPKIVEEQEQEHLLCGPCWRARNRRITSNSYQQAIRRQQEIQQIFSPLANQKLAFNLHLPTGRVGEISKWKVRFYAE